MHLRNMLARYKGAALEVTDAVRKKAGPCQNARTVELAWDRSHREIRYRRKPVFLLWRKVCPPCR